MELINLMFIISIYMVHDKNDENEKKEKNSKILKTLTFKIRHAYSASAKFKKIFVQPFRGQGDKFTLQTDIFAAITELDHENALVTFPRYDWATRCHNYCIYIIVIRNPRWRPQMLQVFVRKTGINVGYNSDYMQDSGIILTTVPMLSRSMNSTLYCVMQGKSEIQDGGLVNLTLRKTMSR